MNDRTASRRRRGQRFRPGQGQTFRPEKAALEARAEALGERPSDENVFDFRRHEREIGQAQNRAAGLPDTASDPATPAGEDGREGLPPGDYRQPHLDVPAEVSEEAATEGEAKPASLMGSIKAAAQKIVRRVQRLVHPREESEKEVVINAESLETRVAVLENARLEEFTIERTEEERLVGSIFKGRVRNLEDGLKAAFVDIGFEKNAFLHYWDIVPAGFDSNVELVERDDRHPREKPKVTQKDIPKLYPPTRTS